MNDPSTALPEWHRKRLQLLIDALGDPPMSPSEKASLIIVTHQDLMTVHNLTATIGRAIEAARTKK